MIFLLDNYDSFTYNLVHLLCRIGEEVVVRRNREVTPEEVLAMRPDGIVLSPGPGRPENAGIMPALVRAAVEAKIPLLGVCLGHQAIGAAFGAEIVGAKEIRHGKTSEISHDGRGLFSGFEPTPFKAVRYHSLALREATLPEVLEVSCRSEDGEIMGIRHRELPIEGIQYHPESIMTPTGKRQLENFLRVYGVR